jgi:hypothetical protein
VDAPVTAARKSKDDDSTDATSRALSFRAPAATRLAWAGLGRACSTCDSEKV